jgi:hypothetical protein
VRWVTLAIVSGLVAPARVAPAWADANDDNHVAPCRPTVTCTADLAPPGTVEVELGFELRHSAGVNTSSFPLLVKLPVTTWLELQVGDVGYTIAPGGSYFDNILIGAKLHLLDQGSVRPSLAITVTASAPGPAEAGYAHLTDGLATAHASKDLGRLHLDANVGVVAWSLNENPKVQPWGAVAATYAVTPRIGVAVEPHAFASAGPYATTDVGGLAAVEVTARPWLIIDGAFYFTATAPTAVEGLVGLSIAPVRLWGGH